MNVLWTMAFVTNNGLFAKIWEGVAAVDAKKVTFWTRTGELAQVRHVLSYRLKSFDHIPLDLFFFGKRARSQAKTQPYMLVNKFIIISIKSRIQMAIWSTDLGKLIAQSDNIVSHSQHSYDLTKTEIDIIFFPQSFTQRNNKEERDKI